MKDATTIRVFGVKHVMSLPDEKLQTAGIKRAITITKWRSIGKLYLYLTYWKTGRLIMRHTHGDIPSGLSIARDKYRALPFVQEAAVWASKLLGLSDNVKVEYPEAK